MRRLINWVLYRRDPVLHYHSIYGRGENFNIDLVWVDRTLWQTKGVQ